MDQVGTYRTIIAGGWDIANHMWGNVPIYGFRVIGLPAIKQDRDQVLVKAFGHMIWINMPRSEVTITTGESWP